MYQIHNINKPAKPYNPDLLTGRPQWEEEVNDLTGRSAGWLSHCTAEKCTKGGN
jgi:hypothetical protein